MKKFQSKDEAIFKVQIILGATVGGKITRCPQRRERRPDKMFETWRWAKGDGPGNTDGLRCIMEDSEVIRKVPEDQRR